MCISNLYAIQCTDYSGTRPYTIDTRIQLYVNKETAERKACEIEITRDYYLVQVVPHKILAFDVDYVDIDES